MRKAFGKVTPKSKQTPGAKEKDKLALVGQWQEGGWGREATLRFFPSKQDWQGYTKRLTCNLSHHRYSTWAKHVGRRGGERTNTPFRSLPSDWGRYTVRDNSWHNWNHSSFMLEPQVTLKTLNLQDFKCKRTVEPCYPAMPLPNRAKFQCLSKLYVSLCEQNVSVIPLQNSLYCQNNSHYSW